MKRSSQTDEQLPAAFARGETSALAELARRYEGLLLGLAGGLLGGRSDLACDAVQEGWVRVIRFASKFDGRSSFKTWVYRIVINQCHNIRSSQPREMPGAADSAARRETEGPERRMEAPTIRDYFVQSVAAVWARSLRFLADTVAMFLAILVGGLVWWVLLAILIVLIVRRRGIST